MAGIGDPPVPAFETQQLREVVDESVFVTGLKRAFQAGPSEVVELAGEFEGRQLRIGGGDGGSWQQAVEEKGEGPVERLDTAEDLLRRDGRDAGIKGGPGRFFGKAVEGDPLGRAEGRAVAPQAPLDDHVERGIEQETGEAFQQVAGDPVDGRRRIAAALELAKVRGNLAEREIAIRGVGGEP